MPIVILFAAIARGHVIVADDLDAAESWGKSASEICVGQIQCLQIAEH